MNDDYKIVSNSDHNGDSSYSATGMSTSVLAARVSYVYNLLGPCLALDTACSSALIAIHLGCQAIKSGKNAFKGDHFLKKYFLDCSMRNFKIEPQRQETYLRICVPMKI